jgi:hypothetical protein
MRVGDILYLKRSVMRFAVSCGRTKVIDHMNNYCVHIVIVQMLQKKRGFKEAAYLFLS